MKQLAKIAQLRTIIMSIIKRASEPVISLDFITHPDVVAIGATEQNVYNALSDMSKTKEIERVRIKRSDAPNCRFAYQLPNADDLIYKSNKVDSTKLDTLLEKSNIKMPEVGVTIIKATGRVRLSLNGLVIEIGVE